MCGTGTETWGKTRLEPGANWQQLIVGSSQGYPLTSTGLQLDLILRTGTIIINYYFQEPDQFLDPIYVKLIETNNGGAVNLEFNTM